ncbi:thiol-disulfide oxidoreductase DCC family protein [soil metagenome]
MISGKPILLFDGVCNLCNGVVQLVINHDPEARIRYTSLQSEAGKQLLDHFGIEVKSSMPDTIVLVNKGKVYVKSEAVLHTISLLGGPYAWLSRPLSWVPLFIRDKAYEWVARNRYRWFGKEESCLLPTPELKARFLA